MVVDISRQWLVRFLPLQRLDKSDQDGGWEDGLTGGWCDGRHTAYQLSRLIACACWADEVEADTKALHESIRRAARFIVRRQSPDGKMDMVGGYTPNEAGFPVSGLVAAYKHVSRACPDLFDDIKDDLKQYITKAADAVLAGEAYTANHRWAAACAPLASAHSLWPDERYLNKIESYLVDGIDCDADGFWYEERSPNYNNVANEGLTVMADCLGRPELLKPVLRNFEFLLQMVQPNGEIDSSFSHRQDRAAANRPVCGYRTARRAAQLTGDGRITTLALQALMADTDLSGALVPILFELDEHPQPMPDPAALPTEYEKYFEQRGMARLRQGHTALTLTADHGKHFFDTIRDQWGGLRLSDDWFHFQHQDIVLQSLQLAPVGMYAVQPRTLLQKGAGNYELAGQIDAWKHTLHFRPGSPVIDMPINLRHHEHVVLNGRKIEVEIQCTAPNSLVASLNLWLRPGVEITEGGVTQKIIAGETLSLKGGTPVVIRSSTAAITITGLPQAAHRMRIIPAQPIPSVMPKTCGLISLGLRMPVNLKFEIQF